MSGIIPEDEEEEQEVYDDVGQIDDDEIYEELPGLTTHLIFPSILFQKFHSSLFFLCIFH